MGFSHDERKQRLESRSVRVIVRCTAADARLTYILTFKFQVFNALQIVSSSLLSFSHGANDTANTVGPLLAVWMTYQTGYAFGAAETRDDSQVSRECHHVRYRCGLLDLFQR